MRWILGQTILPSAGSLSDLLVVWHPNENWFLGGDVPEDQVDFSSTVTYEIVYVIGINHSEQSQALMLSSYSTIIFDIQADDISAAVAIYG